MTDTPPADIAKLADELKPSVARMRKAAICIYIAVEKEVADDISRLLTWGADEIERTASPPAPALDARTVEALEPFVKFVRAREKAWKDIPDDSAFYGEKYPGHNLTHGDFRRLAAIRADRGK